MDLDHVDALANAFNLGYARGRADELAYAAHCGDTDEPLTNADRIRAMTDEELAEWFIKIQDDVADYYDSVHAVAPELPTMKDSWLDWLKQESET